MYVDTQGIDGIDEHVDPEIVLQVVDQVRCVEVVLNDPPSNSFFLRCLLDVAHDCLHFATEEDALALGQPIRLHDVSLSILFDPVCWLVELISEIDIITW